MDATIFTFLNMGALLGWTFVLFLLLSQLSAIQSFLPLTIQQLTLPFFDTPIFDTTTSSPDDRLPIINLLLFLEGICFIEVGRIAIGQLKGNLVLGVILHLIRMSCLLIVLPAGLTSPSDTKVMISTLVLYSWALTEVGRYPMYLFPSSAMTRYVRLVLPIVTFPVGAFAEAVGAYWHLKQLLLVGADDAATRSPFHWVQVGLLVMVVGINSLLGPTMAYPALLKKGLPVLLGKKGKSKSTRKKKD
mmetsp:Transcript_9506/g.11998  ORF Transcript_9506/g.11998 Transcript_9506/m.11998 type:complete len:246 (+) Transcript_9506:72-809(+)